MSLLRWVFGGESRRETKERWRRLSSAIYSARYRDHNFFRDLDHCMNLVDDRGHTPLMMAAGCADLQVVKYCLNRNSASTKGLVNYTGCDETPLMIAVHKCPKSSQHRRQIEAYEEVVRLLLENGAEPDLQPGRDRLTALMIAAQRCNVPLARMLLNHGATVDLVDKRRFNAEAYAKRARCPEFVRLLRGEASFPR